MDLYELLRAKRYQEVINQGLPHIQRVIQADASGHMLRRRKALEDICPDVCHVGQAMEKTGRVDEALDLYYWLIKAGCMGLMPFQRMAIILERQEQYDWAIEVCDRALKNQAWFGGPTNQGAQEEFSKRKTRLEKKKAAKEEQ